MTQINADDIEKYQILMQQNPRSKVFAPLADAYRKMGMLKEAAEVCESGIHYNPDFAGGRLVMARILMERKDYSQAIEELKKATELAPENILAHLLLAENYIAEKQSKLALRSYKMVLFLNPEHERAKKAIQKLESLTADEFDEDAFSMTKLSDFVTPDGVSSPSEPTTEPPAPPVQGNTLLDRHLSLVDAFVARNEIEKAQTAILHAEEELGPISEILKRKKLIFRNRTFDRYEENPEPIQPLRPETSDADYEIEISSHRQQRLQALNELLLKFEAYSDNT